jgi:hypothetical protein
MLRFEVQLLSETGRSFPRARTASANTFLHDKVIPESQPRGRIVSTSSPQAP